MNIQNLKKIAFGLLVVAGITVTGLPSAQAQDGRRGGWERRRDNDRDDDFRGRSNRNGNIDRNRNGVNDRFENRGRWDRNDRRGRWDNDYDNDRFGYNNGERQKGYRDGLDRGQEDARDRRRADPNNSSHYRKGNRVYQDGFRKGYFEGYRQYDNRGVFGNRRW